MAPPSSAFRFSLCADDYAMTPGVSRGILEALDAGALSATSVMTTSPWWPDSAGALAKHADRADIGLHLNLTLGTPLGLMPTFAPGGQFPSIGTIMRFKRRGPQPIAKIADKIADRIAEEIAEEIERQLDRFESVLGRRPDHVDGHQHVHVLPTIRPILFESLARRRWRPLLRDSADHVSRILRRGTTLPKALGLSFLARHFRGEADRHGLPTNDGFAGFSAFDPRRDYADAFARYIIAPGRQHLVMCHPGYVDEHLRGLDPVVETREHELAFLTSKAFAQTLAETGAALGRQSPDQGL